MTGAGARWVVGIIGAMVGVIFYVAMTAASVLGEPLSLVIAGVLGAIAFLLIDILTDEP